MCRPDQLTFAGEQTGALPKTFETALTGQGQAGRWDVIEDPTADDGRALAQLNSDTTDYRFPLAINFQPTGGGKAAITGDFILAGDEVNPVIKALRANGIDVTASIATC